MLSSLFRLGTLVSGRIDKSQKQSLLICKNKNLFFVHFSYSNSPFYWDTNRGKHGQQVFENSNPDEPLPTIKKEKDTKKHLYWKESRKDKDERIEKEKETRKERREKVQRELEEYKISHRVGVLRDRLRVLDSEATIVRNEIRRLESRKSSPEE